MHPFIQEGLSGRKARAQGRRCPRRDGAAWWPRVVAGLALLVAVGCSSSEAPTAGQPAPVTIATATVEAVPVERRGIGTVEADSTVTIKARVSGQLMKVPFSEGQDVSEGDVLFIIDPRPFQAALREAEANLRKDEAQAANAAREAARYAALVAEGVASRETAEQKRAEAEAQAAVVQADRAAVASRRLQVEYCTIRAPIDGRAGEIQVGRGNLVQADTTVLVVLKRLRPVSVRFTLPEQELAEVRRYMALGELQVTAAPPEDPGAPEQGTITFIDSMVDRTTGTFLLRGAFANEALRLWPGQFVQVTLVLTTRPDAIVVPAAAVQAGQGGTYVFVVDPELTAQVRPVEVGERTAEGKVVVTRGLAAGERVVTDGQMRLAPGAKVTITEGPAGGQDAGQEGRP